MHGWSVRHRGILSLIRGREGRGGRRLDRKTACPVHVFVMCYRAAITLKCPDSVTFSFSFDRNTSVFFLFCFFLVILSFLRLFFTYVDLDVHLFVGYHVWVRFVVVFPFGYCILFVFPSFIVRFVNSIYFLIFIS